MSLILKTGQVDMTTVQHQVMRIKQLNTMLATTLDRMHRQNFNEVWKNKHKTPKEIIEAFGKDGVALFQNSSQIQAILAAVDPNYVPLEIPTGYSVAFNKDGTVTVTEPTTTNEETQ